MEWYGKYWCISADELTRDDRTVSDRSDALAPIVTYSNYKKMILRGKLNVVRRGGGRGCPALIDMNSLPEDLKARVRAKYPDADSEGAYLSKVFSGAYQYDHAARAYYIKRLTQLNQSLSNERIISLAEEYATNASVIQSIIRLKQDTTIYRRVRSGKKVSWGEMSDAISYYKEIYGHTLGLTPSRFALWVKRWEQGGYDALISKKFGNVNTLKVSLETEQLLMQLEADPHRPTGKKVWEWYNEFLRGEVQIVNLATGELYDPSRYPDLSEKTVGDVLGKVINRAVSSKRHDSRHDYNTQVRPYQLRTKPKYSLSMVSLDDKDFSAKVVWYKERRKMVRGKIETIRERVTTSLKCYIAYDVASEAIIGWAWSGGKERDIFECCLRSMYRNLLEWGLGAPYEAQVENHLVSLYKDGMMADGALFREVRWAGAENSQEKYAERYHQEVKLGYEKYAFEDVGRHYAKLRSNKTSNQKVNDEENNNYKQGVWDFDVACRVYEEEVFSRYNNALHPNQKLYPGLTRLEVLLQCVHSDIQPIDVCQLSRWLGGRTHTSINREILQINGDKYTISSATVLDKLSGRNAKLTATWWEQTEGDAPEAYLWQDDRLIDICKRVVKHQVSALERTEADAEAFLVQSKRIAEWDRIVKERTADPIMRIAQDKAEQIERKPIRVVAMPLEGDLVEEIDEDTYQRMIQHRQGAAARGAADI
ncbi:MAG: hypothetical protein Q4A64_02540 [Porphyromonadaceae bacterium]|nr:hypothetical protein [Porphyromonadaceae bacterium]